MPSDPASPGSFLLSPASADDGALRHFRWFSDDAPPVELDLRALGWTLIHPGADQAQTCPVLVGNPGLARMLSTRSARAEALVIGVEDSEERAEWLAEGYGDALSMSISLDELEMRALRVTRAITALPRRRRHGPLVLDLLARDGLIEERRLGLHPREFSLLWRLAETPGRPVSADDLLAEVWRMTFRPETNSLAVHVCRLRAKLASVGLSGVVCTSPDGSYFLKSDREGPDPLRRRLAMRQSKAQAGGSTSPRENSPHEA
jgi:two-component system OmpR family response regulator